MKNIELLAVRQLCGGMSFNVDLSEHSRKKKTPGTEETHAQGLLIINTSTGYLVAAFCVCFPL